MALFFWGYGYFALCAQYAYAARLFRALRSIRLRGAAISRFALNTPRLSAIGSRQYASCRPISLFTGLNTGSGYGYFALCAQYAYAARLFRAYRPIFLTNARFS